MGNRGSISSMRDVGGLNSFTGGLGDLIVDIATGHLGDGVAVFNLNRDKLDLGIVNTVLGGHFTASVLDSGGDRVSNSMGSNWSNGNRGSKRSSDGMTIRMSGKELRISFGFSLSLTLTNGVITTNKRGITDGVNDFLANLLVFDLLSVNSLGGANILGRWDTSLGHEDLNLSLAVGSRNNMSSMVRGSNELGISLSLSFGLGGCAGKGKKTRNSKYLHHDEIVRYFPRWLVELK
jgi:hypothetical protein